MGCIIDWLIIIIQFKHDSINDFFRNIKISNTWWLSIQTLSSYVWTIAIHSQLNVHVFLQASKKINHDDEYHKIFSDLKYTSINNHTRTELAAFFGYADLLARWTGQWRTSCFSVESLASEAAIETVAFYALFRRNFLTMIVNYSVQITLLWRQLLIT